MPPDNAIWRRWEGFRKCWGLGKELVPLPTDILCSELCGTEPCGNGLPMLATSCQIPVCETAQKWEMFTVSAAPDIAHESQPCNAPAKAPWVGKWNVQAVPGGIGEFETRRAEEIA